MTNDNNSSHSYASKVWTAAAIIIICSFAIFLFYKIPHIIFSIFSSILFAVFLDGLIRLINKVVKIPRHWSILIVMILIIGLISVTWIYLGPPIAEQFSKMWNQLPQSTDRIINLMKTTQIGNYIFQSFPRIKDSTTSGETIIKVVGGVFSSAFEIIEDLLIIILLGIYLASRPSLYMNSIIALFPKVKRDRLNEVANHLGHGLRYWLIGRLIIMIAVSIITSLGLWLIGMPLSVSLGIITGILAFVPYLGAITAFIPVEIIALAESGSMGLYAAIVYTVLHLIEGYILTPVIQERAVAIPPVLLLTMQIVMMALFGIMGVFVATPLALVLVIIVQMLYVEDVLKDKVKLLGD